ncbi:arylsulfotransferase family protein [Mesorhizobium captivum]|nr:arylsulfotransferase family protein [Mesorhizobium sp. VK22E]
MPMEKIGSTLFVLMIAFLAFVAGAMAVFGRVFPSEFLRDAYRAAESLVLQRQIIENPVLANLYQPARTPARGVTIYDPKRAAPGYTLYTSGDDNVARLIAMDGRVVHEWRRPFSDVAKNGAFGRKPQPDSLVYMDRAVVFPNGDLLVIYISSADTPWGYGMVKLDKDSNVIWSYLAPVHHDLAVAPDNRIYTLSNEFDFNPVGAAPQLDRPHLKDFVVVLSPDGKEIRKVSLTDAFLRSPYFSLMAILPYFALADPLHPNTVEYIDANKAKNFPFAEQGDVLVSFRDMSLIAVLSMKTGEITWATRGPWLGQHDPRILPNGDILLFDNLGGIRHGNNSRVIEYDPRTSSVKWSYAGSAEHPFSSALRSDAQRLGNGNTLITESDGGRIFEVTPAGDIVWEFVNPLRRGLQNELIPIVNGGERIDPAMFEPAFRKTLEEEQLSHRDKAVTASTP